jgi:hypothetical protein
MSKFNLKNYKKNNGDQHITMQLKEQHKDPANTITEKQLDDRRVEEKDVILEKLLDGKRLGSAETLTEQRLNNEKGMFAPFRNSETYTGDINKLEEKRLAGDKMEDEKYESASETPKAQRWWDNLKASSNKKVVEAARRKRPAQPEEGSLDAYVTDTPSRFKEMEELGIGGEGSQAEEGLAPDLQESNEIVGAPVEQTEDIDAEDPIETSKAIEVVKNSEIEGTDFTDGQPVIAMKFAFDPLAFEGQEEIKNLALEKAIEVRPNLQGQISSENFKVLPVSQDGRGFLVLRLQGEQYFAPAEAESSLFTDIDVQVADEGGTPSTIGRLVLSPEAVELAKTEREEFAREATDYILDNNPEVAEALKGSPDVSLEDSLNYALLDQGEVTFVVGTMAPDAGGEEEMFPVEDGNETDETEDVADVAEGAQESIIPEENTGTLNNPLANTAFPIVVLSQSSSDIKKKLTR